MGRPDGSGLERGAVVTGPGWIALELDRYTRADVERGPDGWQLTVKRELRPTEIVRPQPVETTGFSSRQDAVLAALQLAPAGWRGDLHITAQGWAFQVWRDNRKFTVQPTRMDGEYTDWLTAYAHRTTYPTLAEAVLAAVSYIPLPALVIVDPVTPQHEAVR